MRRVTVLALAVLAAGFVFPAPAAAQQSLSIYLGGFTPASEDGRSRDDVLVNNLNFLRFDTEDFNGIKDFNGATFGGEWLVAVGERLEAGLGVGIYSKSVDSEYADLVNEDESDIEQELKLRIIPFTATFRFLPLGREAAWQPYIGAGVGLFRWRYSETGEFVDSDFTVFRDSFVGTGGAAGPVILGGIRFPVGAFDLGGEIRYQNAEGDLPEDQGFSGSKIDLGGMNYLLTLNIRF